MTSEENLELITSNSSDNFTNSLNNAAIVNQHYSSDNNAINTAYDECLDSLGYGYYHYWLLLICGLVNSSDAIEMICVSFLLNDVQLTDNMNIYGLNKGLLTSIIFLGMLLGAIIFGIVADKIGRKKSLITSLLINCVGGALSSAAPDFGLLITFRFFCGLGVGGSIPVLFTYFSEMFGLQRRGRYMVYLAMFWMVGSILVTSFAWIILPQKLSTHSWRVFLLVSSIPCLITVSLFSFLPESPKYLLLRGQISEAKDILGSIHLINEQSKRSLRYKLLAVISLQNINDLPRDSERATIISALPSTLSALDNYLAPSTPPNERNFNHFQRFWAHFVDLLGDRRGVAALIQLSSVWFFLSFSFYGITLFIPSYFRSGSATDLYLSTMLYSVANLPGNLVSIYSIDKLGRVKTLLASALISGLLLFMIYIVPNINYIAVLCLFNAFSVPCWNSLNIISSELFTTAHRSLSFGICSSLGRIGAFIGTLIFGLLIDINAAIPIIVAAGGLVAVVIIMAIYIPETAHRVLQ
jgi:VNT family MFS transporter (synaptic vesicle glycoprotein 2)